MPVDFTVAANNVTAILDKFPEFQVRYYNNDAQLCAAIDELSMQEDFDISKIRYKDVVQDTRWHIKSNQEGILVPVKQPHTRRRWADKEVLRKIRFELGSYETIALQLNQSTFIASEFDINLKLEHYPKFLVNYFRSYVASLDSEVTEDVDGILALQEAINVDSEFVSQMQIHVFLANWGAPYQKDTDMEESEPEDISANPMFDGIGVQELVPVSFSVPQLDDNKPKFVMPELNSTNDIFNFLNREPAADEDDDDDEDNVPFDGLEDGEDEEFEDEAEGIESEQDLDEDADTEDEEIFDEDDITSDEDDTTSDEDDIEEEEIIDFDEADTPDDSFDSYDENADDEEDEYEEDLFESLASGSSAQEDNISFEDDDIMDDDEEEDYLDAVEEHLKNFSLSDVTDLGSPVIRKPYSDDYSIYEGSEDDDSDEDSDESEDDFDEEFEEYDEDSDSSEEESEEYDEDSEDYDEDSEDFEDESEEYDEESEESGEESEEYDEESENFDEDEETFEEDEESFEEDETDFDEDEESFEETEDEFEEDEETFEEDEETFEEDEEDYSDGDSDEDEESYDSDDDIMTPDEEPDDFDEDPDEEFEEDSFEEQDAESSDDLEFDSYDSEDFEDPDEGLESDDSDWSGDDLASSLEPDDFDDDGELGFGEFNELAAREGVDIFGDPDSYDASLAMGPGAEDFGITPTAKLRADPTTTEGKNEYMANCILAFYNKLVGAPKRAKNLLSKIFTKEDD